MVATMGFAGNATKATSKAAKTSSSMAYPGRAAVSTPSHLSGSSRCLSSELRSNQVAEYCNLRSEAAVKLPKHANPVQTAPLLCAGLTVFNSIRHQNIAPGETVVIQGIGGLGHLGIQYARKMGFRVIAVSTSASKREFAMELGAHHYIDSSRSDAAEEIKKLGGAKLVVLTAPNPSLMGQYTACLTWQGKLLVLAGKRQQSNITIVDRHDLRLTSLSRRRHRHKLCTPRTLLDVGTRLACGPRPGLRGCN